MITPYTDDEKIDYASLARLVDWYIKAGVDGLFAVCLSSEMFHLDSDERIDLAKATVDAADGRVPVICSGHVSETEVDQIRELSSMATTGVQGVVLVTNRLARQNESPSVAIKRAESITQELPADIPLGLYECPTPYKRLVSDEFLTWCSDSGRFSFLKDTCCSLELLTRRLQILKGSELKLFNANAATLLASIQQGASGYSGVMANFHPDLYAELWRASKADPDRAAILSDFLGALSLIEAKAYPLSAKVYLKQMDIIDSSFSRTVADDQIDSSAAIALGQLRRMTAQFIGVR